MKLNNILESFSMFEQNIYVNGISYVVDNLLEESDCKRKDVAQILGISPSLISKWLKDTPISCKSLMKLIKMSEKSYDTDDIIKHAEYFSSRNGKRIDIPTNLDIELSYFIGLLMGDGSISSNRTTISITSEVDEEINRSVRILKDRFGVEPRIDDFETYRTVVVNSAVIKGFLVAVFGLVQGKKKGRARIPDIIKEAPREVKIGFVKGFYNSDGSFSVRSRNRKTLSFKQSNRKLLEELRNILTDLGIESNIYPDRTMDSWSLSIFNDLNISKLHNLLNNAALV